MSSSKITLPPYPVDIGSVKSCFPEKHLQDYIQCGNYAKVKQLLKKGIFPDTTNSQGQTPLFVAALLGLRKIVELLLNFGSNPNHRCFDWSTPVHAAAFSCDQWIISKLIDAGGDLRLHDRKSKQPYEWALMAGKDESAQIIDFINRCTIHMEALIHFYPMKPMKTDSSQYLVNSASFIDLLSPRKANRSRANPNKFENLSVKKVCNFGYGQFSVRDNGQAGFLSTFPFIEEKSLVREESVPIVSYAAGPYMTMTNLLWGSTEVTVKGLNDTAPKCFADLLIAEEEKISYMQHPLILQLLALSTSPLERKQLVFERVPFGSFYSIIHERRSEFPTLDMKTIITILLQMIEALVFLHWRGFIHRSFSSHTIQILSVDTGRAKISNFEYMVERKDKVMCDGIIIPIPAQLYRWSSPEVVAGKTGTIKSDLYSFCAVMQESLTDSLPWSGVDDNTVKEAIASGHYLTVESNLSEPCYTIVSTGIQARPQERVTHLQDIGYLLKNNYKHVLDKVPCRKRAPKVLEAERDCKGQDIPPDRFKEISDQFCTRKDITSYNSSSAFSSMEPQSGTLRDMGEQTNETMAHSCSLEKEGQNRAGNFYQENVGSDFETDTNSDSEEIDIDFSSLESNELQTLQDRGDSIHIHNKSTLDNLQYIQTLLQELNAGSDAEEEREQAKSVFLEENEFPVTVKVKHVHPLYKGKFYAKGPPLHYVPPEFAPSSRIDITSVTRRIQSENVVDAMKKASKKEEWCAGSLKGKTLEKLSTGQDSLQLTEKSSKQSEENDNIMRHPYYPSPNSAQQGKTKTLAKERLLSSLLKSSSQHPQNKKQCEHVCDNDKEEQTRQEQRSNKDRCKDADETKLEKLFRCFAGRKYQSPENEDDCEIPAGIKPLQVSSKDNDDSNDSTETCYFTPETDVDKTEQETLNVCDESDHSFGEWSPRPCSTVCFDKTLLASTDERALEINTPGHRALEKNTQGHAAATFGLSTNTRSTIDVEELSGISCDQKSSFLQFTTPRNTESSLRHSTPFSPGMHMLGAINKRKFSHENQLKSPSTPNDKSIASQSTNSIVSSKTSECFLSAMCESTDYIGPHQEKTLTVKDQNANITSNKTWSEDDVLPQPQCSLNKTDLQCQSMEITCLINETICGQHF